MSNRRSLAAWKVANKVSVAVLVICINLVFYGAVAYGIYRAADYSYDFAYEVFGDSTVEEEGRDVTVTIMKGESAFNIASKLEDSKIVVNRYTFYAKLLIKRKEVMPGTFVLNTAMTYNDVIDIITDYSKSIDAEKTVEDVESSP